MSASPFPDNSYEAFLLQSLRSDDDRLAGIWNTEYARVGGSFRRVLAAVSRAEALSLIERGGNFRIAALSEHPDGRVREAALRALEPDPATSLIALLKRANDWVKVVARLAGERALALLPQADDATLLLIAPLIFALTRQSRVDHGRLVSGFLHQTRTRPGLARRIRRAYRNGPFGEWASWWIAGDEETGHDLTQERLKTGTPRLQLQAAREIVGEPGRWRELLASRNPQLRRIALDHASPEAIEAALDDANAGVRNDARFLLGKRDFAAHYRGRLPSPGAVSGLGETGGREDAEALLPPLAHPSAEVRARAVEAIFRLRGDDAEPQLLAALLDPMTKVQRTAAEALVRSNLGFVPESVLRWPLKASIQRLLLRRTPRWASLLAVLRAADTLEGAEAWLVQWAHETNFRPTPPKPDELAEARSLLQASTLSPTTVASLRAATDLWRV